MVSSFILRCEKTGFSKRSSVLMDYLAAARVQSFE